MTSRQRYKLCFECLPIKHTRARLVIALAHKPTPFLPLGLTTPATVGGDGPNMYNKLDTLSAKLYS